MGNYYIILFRYHILFILQKTVYQSFKIPISHNQHFQENQLYQNILIYVNPLPSIEDFNFSNLIQLAKSFCSTPSDISSTLTPSPTKNSTTVRHFSWCQAFLDRMRIHCWCSLLTIKKEDKPRIFHNPSTLSAYLSVAEDIKQKKKQIELIPENLLPSHWEKDPTPKRREESLSKIFPLSLFLLLISQT